MFWLMLLWWYNKLLSSTSMALMLLWYIQLLIHLYGFVIDVVVMVIHWTSHPLLWVCCCCCFCDTFSWSSASTGLLLLLLWYIQLLIHFYGFVIDVVAVVNVVLVIHRTSHPLRVCCYCSFCDRSSWSSTSTGLLLLLWYIQLNILFYSLL